MRSRERNHVATRIFSRKGNVMRPDRYECGGDAYHPEATPTLGTVWMLAIARG